MGTEIIYSNDVSIEHHVNMLVFEDSDGEVQAFYIVRPDDTEQILVHTVELFKKPSDSWVGKNDLKGLNTSCDTDYQYDEELDDLTQYNFTENLCWYFGANNFDSEPIEFETQEEFEEWLHSMELI